MKEKIFIKTNKTNNKIINKTNNKTNNIENISLNIRKIIKKDMENLKFKLLLEYNISTEDIDKIYNKFI